jgi:hypothetical protein
LGEVCRHAEADEKFASLRWVAGNTIKHKFYYHFWLTCGENPVRWARFLYPPTMESIAIDSGVGGGGVEGFLRLLDKLTVVHATHHAIHKERPMIRRVVVTIGWCSYLG